MFHQKEVNKKFIKLCIFFFTLFIGILCFIQFIDYSMIKPIDITNITENDDIEYEIDNINIDSHYVAISGYALIIGEQPRNFDINVVIKNIETGQAYELPTVLVNREDLNNLYSDEIDYSNSAFFTKFNKYLINYNKNTYEIYIKFYNNQNRFFIRTNQIISEDVGD